MERITIMTTRTIANSVLKRGAASLALAATLCAPSAWALSSFSITNGPSTEGLGTFSGTVTYDPSAAAELTISLTNTSPAANGGFITGIAFNLGGTVTALTEPFAGISAADAFETNPSVSPYGNRNWGSALGGNWLGGGSPNGGVGVGSTGVWTFDVVGGPATLSVDDLNMVVRFRGFVNEGSDKVITVVPEPEAYALAVAGLGILAVAARRRRRS